jgi:hypothetical protein
MSRAPLSRAGGASLARRCAPTALPDTPLRMLARSAARSFCRLASALVALACLSACGSAPSKDAAPPAPASSANDASGSREKTPDLAALSAEVERRGQAALPGGSLATAFARKGNMVVSPFGLGLTRVTAEALLSSTPSDLERFTALTHTTASCAGSVSFGHAFAFSREVAVQDEADKLAWRLSPGQHLLFDEPGTNTQCATVYSPLFRTDVAPALDDLYPGERGAVREPVPGFAGKRLGLSRVFALVQLRPCRAATPAFRACGQPASGEDSSPPNLLAPPKPLPLGIEVRTDARVLHQDGATLVSLALERGGVSTSSRRKQSFVLALPDAACESVPFVPSPELVRAMVRAAGAPRETKLRLQLPRIETSTRSTVLAPSPLDALLVSTELHTAICQPSPAEPVPEGMTTIAFNRPFVYALIDDDTQTLLALGRFDELTSFERQTPLGIPPSDGTIPRRNDGGLAPLERR